MLFLNYLEIFTYIISPTKNVLVLRQLENAQYLAVQTTAMTVPPGTTSHIPYANPPPGFPPIALPPPGYAYPPPVHPGKS